MDSQPLPLKQYPVLVTRPIHAGCALVEGLEAAGVDVLSWPLIETAPSSFSLPDAQQAFHGVFFSSQQAVHSFFANAEAAQWFESQTFPVYAVGKETAAAIMAYTTKLVFVPDVFDSLSACRQWVAHELWLPQDRILWPCGNLVNPELLALAEANSLEIVPLTVYQTMPKLFSSQERQSFLQDVCRAKCWVFTSPSAIAAFLALLPDDALRADVVIACMGARTADAASDTFGRCDVLASPNTLAGLSRQIVRHMTGESV